MALANRGGLRNEVLALAEQGRGPWYKRMLLRASLLGARIGMELHGANQVRLERLADIVFNDASELHALEAISHPAISATLKEWVKDSDADVIVVEMSVPRDFLGVGPARTIVADVDIATRRKRLIDKGMAVKRAVMAAGPVIHPFEEDLSFLYGTIFIGPPQEPGAHSRNVCIFAEGEVDRSPTGTGVSARLAIHHARGEIGLNESITIESIIGSRFSGRVVRTTTFGPYAAIIPEVEGTAHITGRHEFLIDPDDSMKNGFVLR